MFSATSGAAAGGSHWTLLAYSRLARIFFHLDSTNGAPPPLAAAIVRNLADALRTATAMTAASTPWPSRASSAPAPTRCQTMPPRSPSHSLPIRR
jgi:hypothetical protein